jgi:signal transduction histidine kinase
MNSRKTSTQKTNFLVLVSGFVSVIIIGILDYLAGPGFSSLLAYLIPVIIVSRYAGRLAGISTSIASAAIWIAADMAAPNYVFLPVAYWNHLEKLIIFLIIVFIMMKLTQKEEEKQNMISMLAHDMKNPAMVARGFASRLLAGKSGSLTEKQEGHIRLVKNELERLERLLLDFLEMSRLESKKCTLNPRPVDLTANIKKHIEAASLEAKKKKIDIFLDCPYETVPPVNADESQLDRVVRNLLANAINYTDSGGAITIKIEVKNKSLLVQVKDTGRGIPKEHIKHIFKPFHRVANDTRGSGLGLPVVKSLVKAHGGKIWVESVPGQGSTFSFTIPLCNTSGEK